MTVTPFSFDNQLQLPMPVRSFISLPTVFLAWGPWDDQETYFAWGSMRLLVCLLVEAGSLYTQSLRSWRGAKWITKSSGTIHTSAFVFRINVFHFWGHSITQVPILPGYHLRPGDRFIFQDHSILLSGQEVIGGADCDRFIYPLLYFLCSKVASLV